MKIIEQKFCFNYPLVFLVGYFSLHWCIHCVNALDFLVSSKDKNEVND